MRSTAFSGTMVSASTKQRTRPELATTPALRAAAHVPPTHGTRRTPASSTNRSTITAVASSLQSSATMTSNAVSWSQRSARDLLDARATLTRMASSTSAISASSFLAGMTNERRILLIQFPACDYQGAAGQNGPLASRSDPQPGRCDFPLQVVSGKETPGVHAELRIRRDVADEPRYVERHDRPDELAHAKPRVTEPIAMEGLHHDYRSTGDASRFGQHAGRILRVGQHEEQQRSREGSFFERKNPIGDQDGSRPHDMDIAHVGCDDLEAQLLLQSGREMSCP